MADTEPHGDDAPGPTAAAADHATDEPVDEHVHDDHAHGDELLGPLDVNAWGAGVLGVLLGLAVALAFVLATLPV